MKWATPLGFVVSFHFVRLEQICLNIDSLSGLPMDENENQWSSSNVFHALFVSSSFCTDVRNRWMKDVSMGRCCLSLPVRACPSVFSFPSRKKSARIVFMMESMPLLKLMASSFSKQLDFHFWNIQRIGTGVNQVTWFPSLFCTSSILRKITCLSSSPLQIPNDSIEMAQIRRKNLTWDLSYRLVWRLSDSGHWLAAEEFR